MNLKWKGAALAPLALSAQICFATPQSSEDLAAEAQVAESQARAAALAKVPGTVKSHELERENGRVIWTYDIARPSVRGVTEVHVDAITGRVLSVRKETPRREAAEARAEKGEQ